VATVHDPVINRISNGARSADHRHDAMVHNKLFPAFERGDRRAAQAALRKADRFVRVPYAALLKIQARIDALRQADVRAAESSGARARLLGILAAIVGVLMAIGIAGLITRSIRRPIFDLMRLSERAAEGDLTCRSSLAGRDELGRLAAAFNAMTERLNDVVSRIGHASETVLEAADHMAT